jgi:hypothetical protein
MLFDGNFMKFVESNYKFLSGYSQGGPKLRGDNVIVSVILVSAFIGVILGLVALRHMEKLSLTVLVVTCPFQLHCSGCLEVWGAYKWMMPALDRLYLQQWFHYNNGTKELEMGGSTNPIGLHVNQAGNVVQDMNVGQDMTVEVESSDGGAIPSTNLDVPAMPRDRIESSSSSSDGMDSRSSMSLQNIIVAQLHKTIVFDRAPLQPRQLEQYEDLMNAFGHRAELARMV